MHLRQFALALSAMWTATIVSAATLDMLQTSASWKYGYISDVASDGSGGAFVVGNSAAVPPRHARIVQLSKTRTRTSTGFLVHRISGGDVKNIYFTDTDVYGVSRVAPDAQHRPVIAGVRGEWDYSDYSSETGKLRQVFVCKFDATGTNLLWKSLFGAAPGELNVRALTISESGAIYVGGIATSNAFPTAHSIGPVAANRTHPFVAKLSSAGAVEFVTLFGGREWEYLEALATDAENNAYACGWGYMTEFPVSSGDGTSTSTRGIDLFVAKLSNDGASLVSSKILGGDCEDRAMGMSLDRNGNIYIVGGSCSQNFPGIEPAAAPTNSNYRGFLTKLDASATNIVFTKLINHTGNDRLTSVRTQPDGTLVLAGDFNSYFESPGGAFIATADANGTIAISGLAPGCAQLPSIEKLNVDARGVAFACGLLPNNKDSYRYGLGSYAARVPVPPAKAAEKPQLLLFDSPAGLVIGTNAPLTLTVVALGVSSNVTVRFYDGRQLLGTATNAPYQLIASNWPRGSHTISAATVVSGKTVTSCRVRIRAKSPPNDRFENSTVVSGDGFTVRGILRGATSDPIDPNSALDVWWSWTAPRDESYNIQALTKIMGFPQVDVYTGSVVTNLTQISPISGVDGTTFRAEAGTTYHFRVSGYFFVDPGVFRLQMRSVTPPANDLFADASDISGVPAEVSGTTRYATREPGELGYGNSVWYRWTAPSDGLFVANAGLASTVAYEGVVVDALTSRSQSIEGGDGGSAFYASADEDIYIAVSRYGIGTNFTLGITERTPPANDNFNDAKLLVGVSAHTNATTVGATREPDETVAGFYNGTLWWKWVAPTTGVFRAALTFAQSSSGAIYPASLATVSVFTGDAVYALHLVASESGAAAFRAEAGVEYRFSIATYYYFDQIAFSITPASPPSNDDFANATIVTGLDVVTQGTLRDATTEAGESHYVWNGNVFASVWYEWIAPSNGAVAIEAAGGPQFTAYVGDTLGGLNGVASGTRAVLRVSAGERFRIAVFPEPFNDETSFTLRIRAVTPPTNDDITNAIPLNGLTPTFQANGANATSESDELLGTGSQWWIWTAPSNGMMVLHCSDYARMGVFYRASSETFVPIASGFGSSVSFQVKQGVTFHIGIASAAPVHCSLTYEPPPINDHFEDAMPISSLPFSSINVNYAATRQPGEPQSQTFANSEQTLWWTWTSPGSGPVLIEAATQQFTPTIAVYSGDTFVDLAEICAGYSSIVLHAVTNTTYRIVVGATWNLDGEFTLSLTPLSPPVNDQFAARSPMTNNIASGSIAGASIEPFESTNREASVWWRWLAPSSGYYSIEAPWNFSATLYTGDAFSNLTYVGAAMVEERISQTVFSKYRIYQVEGGVEYVVRISADDQTLTDYAVRLQHRTPPANDDFSHALPLTGGHVVATATNTFASKEAGEPNPYSAWATLWWRWTAPSNGAVMVDVSDSLVHTDVSIYTGDSLTNLQALPNAYTPYLAKLIRTESGKSYAIQVATLTGTYPYGKVILKLAVTNAPPNDDLANRVVLSGAHVSVHGSNRNSTPEVGEPATQPGFYWLYGRSVWYAWTPPFNGVAALQVASSNHYFLVAAFTGTTVTNIQILDTNRWTSAMSVLSVSAGIEYIIGIEGGSGDVGDFDLTINLAPLTPPVPVARIHTTVALTKSGDSPAVIETSTNLCDWMPFQTNTESSSEIHLPISPERQRFFRIR